MLERRTFLATLTAGLATAATPGTLLAACRDLVTAGPAAPQKEIFRRLVGSRLNLANEAGNSSAAELVAFDEGPSSSTLEQFSFVLDCAETDAGLYKLRHRDTGSMLVHMEPSDHVSRHGRCFRVYVSRFV